MQHRQPRTYLKVKLCAQKPFKRSQFAIKYTQYAFSALRGCQIKRVQRMQLKDTLFYAAEPVSTKYGLGYGKSDASALAHLLEDLVAD